MLKWAGLFLILMIVAGLLGFVFKVAGFIFQALFVVCVIAFGLTLVARALGRRT